MNAFAWEFPPNDSNETEGPNDGGITHFTANRSANVIRECIQNSLDAQKDESSPVRVRIQLISLPRESFNAEGLMIALGAAVSSKHNDEAHRKQFQRGQNFLKGTSKGVDTLTIIDSNTTGASDDLSLDGKPTKWEALTKSTGLSIKERADSGGSFGLGKHAPFAVTDIRTVLYSTAWVSNNKLNRRFQGKTILVSHIDSSETKRRRTGYLGAGNFTPLQDDEVPELFCLDNAGLAVYIPAYVPETDWKDQSIRAVIEHFFHAIVHRGLEVEVEGTSLEAATLNEHSHLVGDRTAAFIEASRSTPVATTQIAGIGQVTLRIVPNAGEVQTGRQIALVRDSGMMIADRPREMSLHGLSRIPPHWQKFVAIIECRSFGEPSLLRDSESPSHSSISVQQIADREKRGQAATALRQLGNWCRTEIEARVDVQPKDDAENVSEIAKYLSVRDSAGTYMGTSNGHDEQTALTKPEQSIRAPASNWARGGRRVLRATTGGEGEIGVPRKKGKGNKKKRTGTTPRVVPSVFSNVRFTTGFRRPTHSVVAIFDTVSETLRDIQLMAVVEDGQDVQVGISEAYAEGRKLLVKHNKVTSFSPSKGARSSIEFLTQIPATNKTYYLLYGGS